MRTFTRVVETAALIRDRPAVVVKSATCAFSLRNSQRAHATPFRLVAPTPQSQSDIRTGLSRSRPSCRMRCGTRQLLIHRVRPGRVKWKEEQALHSH